MLDFGTLYQSYHTQRVGWVERSDTHQFCFAKMMGYARGSTHSAGYLPPSFSRATIACFADAIVFGMESVTVCQTISSSTE
jgi:hypothetical protein